MNLLGQKSSFARIRGGLLCLAQAKWDKEGEIEKTIDQLFTLLYDEKPSVVRQFLAARPAFLRAKQKLKDEVYIKIKEIDLDRYKESAGSLIEKDIQKLVNQ